jgi:hypothetical protein
MTTLPRMMNGRNLPILVSVRSMKTPMNGSITASKMRVTVTIVVAKARSRPRTPLA